MLMAALLIRAWDFGNPVIHVDEQYYLLVGDRLWHGAIPYLTIWDRKPIGLFLLFGAIRALPGDGILAYQVIAMLFAAATAWVVAQGARKVGGGIVGSLAASIAYLLWLSLLGGRGGQAPVFYNLPVAIAGVLALNLPTLVAMQRRGDIVRQGAVACLLLGLAIQIKYTALFEGIGIGLLYAWHLHRAGAARPHVLAAATLWAILGALPTLAVLGWYAALGGAALQAFWFANVTSIALRPPYPIDQLAMRLLGIAAQLLPLAIAGVLAWRKLGTVRSPAWLVAAGWLAAALVGFLSIGTFFDHYALPLLAPLAIVAAPALDRWRRWSGVGLLLAAVLLIVERVAAPDDAPGARAVGAVVRANAAEELGRGCPYVFIGDTVTYLLGRACLPTAYAFPNFLAYTTEQGATGIDEAAEVRRILAHSAAGDRHLDAAAGDLEPGKSRGLARGLAGVSHRVHRPAFRLSDSGMATARPAVSGAGLGAQPLDLFGQSAEFGLQLRDLLVLAGRRFGRGRRRCGPCRAGSQRTGRGFEHGQVALRHLGER